MSIYRTDLRDATGKQVPYRSYISDVVLLYMCIVNN